MMTDENRDASVIEKDILQSHVCKDGVSFRGTEC